MFKHVKLIDFNLVNATQNNNKIKKIDDEFLVVHRREIIFDWVRA